jgi:hypothetical protein
VGSNCEHDIQTGLDRGDRADGHLEGGVRVDVGGS